MILLQKLTLLIPNLAFYRHSVIASHLNKLSVVMNLSKKNKNKKLPGLCYEDKEIWNKSLLMPGQIGMPKIKDAK